jgi:hypothetical protein
MPLADDRRPEQSPMVDQQTDDPEQSAIWQLRWRAMPISTTRPVERESVRLRKAFERVKSALKGMAERDGVLERDEE